MTLSEDIRTADPEAGGQMLFHFRQLFPDVKMSELADRLDWSMVPRVDSNESVAVLTKRKYIGELKSRAENGDKFAVSLLEHRVKTGSFNGAPTEPAE